MAQSVPCLSQLAAAELEWNWRTGKGRTDGNILPALPRCAACYLTDSFPKSCYPAECSDILAVTSGFITPKAASTSSVKAGGYLLQQLIPTISIRQMPIREAPGSAC